MVNFTTPDQVFWLDRKHLLHKERLRHDRQRTRWRYIVDVRSVPSRPVLGLQVDSADRLPPRASA
jgi:replicative DNA helicase